MRVLFIKLIYPPQNFFQTKKKSIKLKPHFHGQFNKFKLFPDMTKLNTINTFLKFHLITTTHYIQFYIYIPQVLYVQIKLNNFSL